MTRNSSFTQLPRLVGIFPNNIFLEITKYSKFIKFPTSIGRTSVNLLAEKSRAIGESERPITAYDIVPLRLLLERFKLFILSHLPILKAMLP